MGIKNPGPSTACRPRARGDARTGTSAQPPGVAPPNTTHDLNELFVTIFRYRHLLMNFESEYRKRARRVRGPRAAAVLARLWANEDLGLQPTSQKVVGFDLGIGPSELGKILADLRKPGTSSEGCVKLVSDQYSRQNLYEITGTGKQELESWLLVSYAPRPFMEFITNMSPNPDKVIKLVESLKRKVKEDILR